MTAEVLQGLLLAMLCTVLEGIAQVALKKASAGGRWHWYWTGAGLLIFALEALIGHERPSSGSVEPASRSSDDRDAAGSEIADHPLDLLERRFQIGATIHGGAGLIVER